MGASGFAGPPPYLAEAAGESGRPELAGPAGRVALLGAIGTLCAQASTAEAGHVAAILVEAGVLADRLRVAARAAELMVDAVRTLRGLRSKATAAGSRRGAGGTRGD